jgi:transposase InsO family protein
VAHANARLNVHGRRLLILRVIEHGRPVAHVAKELGISRQCANRWINRFRAEGVSGLVDRSSRPQRCPRRTPASVEGLVLELRRRERRGQDWIAGELGISARTVSAILRRHRVPYLAECDPLTGELIRASRTTRHRYERDRPGELVHVDVKKLGRIPDGGGWRSEGLRVINHRWAERTRVGYDYVHSAVDDHSRLAYSEALPDEKATTCAAFLRRAADYFAAHGIARIEAVMTDNALAYRTSSTYRQAVADLGATQVFTRPHCPWQNGKVERFNRTIQTEWAYRHIFTSNNDRTDALAPWLEHYNTQRRHSAIGGHPPTSRLS